MKYILKFSADVQFASRFVYTIRELVLSGFYFLNSSWGFPGGASGKESACNAGDTGEMGSIPGSVRFPGVGNGKPLQYSGLENPMDREAWCAIVHGVTKSGTWLSTQAIHPSPSSVKGTTLSVLDESWTISYICIVLGNFNGTSTS